MFCSFFLWSCFVKKKILTELCSSSSCTRWLSGFLKLVCMLPLLHNTFGYLSLAVLRSCYISTLKDPTEHLPGRRVPCVISNAEGVFLGQLSRSIFDGCCDHKLADFELQCTMAKHPSWKIMAALISRYLNGFFKLHGNGLCWRAINTSGNICCSIRALRYCSVFWSHDRCIISTSRWSCGASTRPRSTSCICTATLWPSCECKGPWMWHMQVTWHMVICSMISEMRAVFVKSITLTTKHLRSRGMWACLGSWALL